MKKLPEMIDELFRDHRAERIKAPGAIDAAVLIPLVERNGEDHILFELRNPRIDQGGEVCFPGGRVESGETTQETVIRETMEELEIGREQIRVIAPLYRMTGPGGSEISAFLGRIEDYKDSWSADEVSKTFLVPLRELLDMEPLISGGRYEMHLNDGFPYDMIQNGKNYRWHKIRKNYYFYKTKPEIVWGMTAELLYHFLEELKGSVSGKES